MRGHRVMTWSLRWALGGSHDYLWCKAERPELCCLRDMRISGPLTMGARVVHSPGRLFGKLSSL